MNRVLKFKTPKTNMYPQNPVRLVRMANKVGKPKQATMNIIRTVRFRFQGTALAAACLLLVGPAVRSWAAESHHALAITWGDKGLVDIRHNGRPFLKAEPSGVQLELGGIRVVPKAGGEERDGERTCLDHSFSLHTKTESFKYAWGGIACRYEQDGDVLHFYLKVTNDSADEISGVRIRLLSAQLPTSYTNIVLNNSWSTKGSSDSPALGVFDSHGGNVGISNWETGRPISFGLDWERGRAWRELLITTEARQASPRHPIFDLSYFQKPPFAIMPGKSCPMHVSLGFSKEGGDSLPALCGDALREYANMHPFRLRWEDRRPIGALFLAQAARGWPKNPRGYVTGLGEKEDVTTLAGRKIFADGLMAYADRSIAILKEAGAQGALVWDIEGQEYPHFISYVGQPDLLPKIAPEMDAVADAFFKKFTAAGLKVGICIRPTEAFRFEKGEMESYPYKHGFVPVWHRQVKDPGDLINRKITYAQRRWGCTIFYLDSNGLEGFVDPKDGSAPAVRGIPGDLPLAMYEKALDGHPDVLLIPEHFQPFYWAFSAPYQSPNLQQIYTDYMARLLYPKGCSFINTGYELLRSRWGDYEREVADGSILAFNAWFASGESKYVKALYQTVAFNKAGVPETLRKANLTELSTALKSAEASTRYWAVKKLADFDTKQALEILLTGLDDKELAVRKGVIDGIGRVSLAVHEQDHRGLNVLLRIAFEAKDDESLIQPFAAEALAHVADLAAGPLLEKVRAARQSGKDYAEIFATAARVFSAVKMPSEDMVQELIACAKNKAAGLQLRQSAVTALGVLKAKQSVPALIEVLSTLPGEGEAGWLGCATVEALGRIGDPRAVGAIVKDFKRFYGGSVAVYEISRCRHEALSKLTGIKDYLDDEAWEKWWEVHGCQENSDAR